MLQMISTDWQDYSSNRSTSCIMINTANLAHRISRWIVGTQLASASLYSVGVLATNANSPEKLEPYARELILKMELPFNISTNFIYTTVQLVQFYHLALVAWGIMIINALFVTLVSLNCAICEIKGETNCIFSDPFNFRFSKDRIN